MIGDATGGGPLYSCDGRVTSVGQSVPVALMLAPLTFVLVTLVLDVAYRLGLDLHLELVSEPAASRS